MICITCSCFSGTRASKWEITTATTITTTTNNNNNDNTNDNNNNNDKNDHDNNDNNDGNDNTDNSNDCKFKARNTKTITPTKWYNKLIQLNMFNVCSNNNIETTVSGIRAWKGRVAPGLVSISI